MESVSWLLDCSPGSATLVSDPFADSRALSPKHRQRRPEEGRPLQQTPYSGIRARQVDIHLPSIDTNLARDLFADGYIVTSSPDLQVILQGNAAYIREIQQLLKKETITGYTGPLPSSG